MISESMLDYFLNIRMQLACFIILQFIIWTFFSVIRKQTYANRLFSALLGATVANLILDMVSVYTLCHLDAVSVTLDRVVHIAFVLSSVAILYITYLYVKSITIELPPRLHEMIPLAVSVLCAVVLPFEYIQTPRGYVVSGPAVGVPYMCAGSYYLVCILLLVRFRKKMELKTKRGIVIALMSLLFVTLIQTFERELLVSGVGFTVIVTALFYTLESPDALMIEKLAYERNRADTANKAKSAFLANMSHEIRTPINAILGMDEMILRESGERETLSYATDIQAAGRTLLSLINDILDFSKVEEGKMEIIPTQYELRSVINDLVNMVRERADKKGLRLEVDLDESTPQLLYGDAVRIRQCALNILTNAVKYTDVGSVTLGVHYEKKKNDAIALTIRVTDTGIGMKQADMDKLFSPFARIEEERNRTIEGTGLGMSITKQLLELMGSRLEVVSEYGKGSVFSFTIEQPVIKWDPIGPFTLHTTEVRQTAYRELFHAPDARILVVDDMPMNLTVMQGLLKKTQVVVEVASSGREAIRMVSKQPYDVVFVDHMMPEMDGIQTLQKLEQLPQAEKTVFIALTANAVSGAREMYIEAGFADYLSKPVDGRRLETMLMRYLPREKLATPAEAAESTVKSLPVILVADDDEAVRRLVTETLADGHVTYACRTAAEVMTLSEQHKPDLILLGVRLNGGSGFEVLQSLKHNAQTCEIPVVLLMDEENPDVETLGTRNGATDFIRKQYLPDVLTRRVRSILEINRMKESLQNEVKQQILRIERLSKEMMLTLSKAVDAKDRFTNGHSARVAAYSAELARRMGKNMQEQEQVYEAALLHDLGKIGVSEELLNKPGELTEEELASIRRHTVIGSDILGAVSVKPELTRAARSHHERYDGSGFPDGLKGNDIPEIARIICVADAYDAMTSTRSYSSAWPQSDARAEIARCSGTQFDPQVARHMLAMIDEDAGFRMNERLCGIEVWKNHDQLWSLARKAPGGEAVSMEEGPEAPGLPEWLGGVEGLDVSVGVRCCGSPESYLEALKVYAGTGVEMANEIEAYWNEGDIESTTVKVHALKSTSKTVGASTLGALAEKLEAAGRAGDEATLQAEIGTLLERYRSLTAQLSPLILKRNEANLPPITPAQLREAYDAIREFAEAFDFDSVAFTVNSLRDYRIPPEEAERCASLVHAVDNFDWDQIGALLE